MGQSWGAALALAYAQQWPERVRAMVWHEVRGSARGVGLALWQRRVASAAWMRFVAVVPGASDLVAAYDARLTCGDIGADCAVAREWCAWEQALATKPAVPLQEDGAWVMQRRRAFRRTISRAGPFLAMANCLPKRRG